MHKGFNDQKLYSIFLGRFHDAGTYDAITKTGGPNGSIRNQEELNHSANMGLDKAVKLCGEISVHYSNLFIFSFS